MTRSLRLAVALCFGGAALVAQTTAASVEANGTSTIYVQPDQAELTVSVTTQGTTATAAGQQNANASAVVTKAITSVLGSNGSIKTVSYSVYPQYGVGAQSLTIVAYAATNTFQVTMNDLTLIGSIIDAANQAGSTSVGGLSLGLQNPAPSFQQALTAASKLALANAGAIASGLGRTTGAVISAQQSSAYTPVIVTGVAAGTAASATQVQTGPVSVSATVTVTVQLQ